MTPLKSPHRGSQRQVKQYYERDLYDRRLGPPSDGLTVSVSRGKNRLRCHVPVIFTVLAVTQEGYHPRQTVERDYSIVPTPGSGTGTQRQSLTVKL